MMNAMRLMEGSDANTFTGRTGLPFECVKPALNGLRARDLVTLYEDNFSPTPRGQQFLNNLLLEFMPDEDS
jgi:oxygen-independent coproporphyrinogen-3 oxidase